SCADAYLEVKDVIIGLIRSLRAARRCAKILDEGAKSRHLKCAFDFVVRCAIRNRNFGDRDVPIVNVPLGGVRGTGSKRIGLIILAEERRRKQEQGDRNPDEFHGNATPSWSRSKSFLKLRNSVSMSTFFALPFSNTFTSALLSARRSLKAARSRATNCTMACLPSSVSCIVKPMMPSVEGGVPGGGGAGM